MDNYKKQCPIDGGTCGQGGTCFVCENESLGAELAAAKARITELEKALDKDRMRDLFNRFHSERYNPASEEYRFEHFYAALLKEKE